jgi:hypothetical protein
MLPSEIKSLKMPELRAYAKERGIKAEPTDTKEALQAKVLGVSDIQASTVALTAKMQVTDISIVEPVVTEPKIIIDIKDAPPEVVIDAERGALLPDDILPRIRQLQDERGLRAEIDTEALCVTFYCGIKMQSETLRQESRHILAAAEAVCSRVIRPADVGILDNMKGAW